MAVAALLSMALIVQVTGRLEDLTQSYVPAYGSLARANIRTLEQAVALRRMVIQKMQTPADDEQFVAARKMFEASAKAVDAETQTARALLDGLIARGPEFGDAPTWVRLDTRLVDLMNDTHRRLDEEIARLLPLLNGGDHEAMADELERVDLLRDEFDSKLDAIRADMLKLLQADSAATVRKQQTVMVIAVVLTVLAATLGFVFAIIVSTGLILLVHRQFDGTPVF